MEGKLRKNCDKIEPFPIVSENNESVDEMDEALRQQLIKEADEYEKILNSNPCLDYIDEMDESPELFEAVIQKLKDEKKWGDEDEADAARKEEDLVTAMGGEEKEKVQSGENREKVYKMLSDEDRRALAIGRRKLKQHKRTKILKASGIAAMVCLCLFGVSMTSTANREYLLALFNTNAGSNLQVVLENKGDSHKEGNISEEQAIEDIEKRLDIKTIKLKYKPDGMEFLSVNIDEMVKEAILQYMYKDTIVNIYVNKTMVESSTGRVFDGKVIGEFTVDFDKDDIIMVTEMENPNSEISYVAQLNLDDCYYSITAIMSKEDMVKMLKNIYF